MSELKPCPFCGTSNCEIVSNGHDSQFVECMFCGASGPAHENHDETTEAWNRRAQPAQAVPVLTDAEIHAADPIPQNRFDQERVEFARRVEQAVRAKMGAAVPMTHMQIVTLWGHRSDGPSTPEIVSFARLVERHHGIVGKEGA